MWIFDPITEKTSHFIFSAASKQANSVYMLKKVGHDDDAEAVF